MPARLLDTLWLDGVRTAASGTVRFYQPGTLTPVNVYSDDATTTVVTQPVSLDANGRSTVPIYVKAMVRGVFFDSAGAQLIDTERLDGDRAELVSLVNTKWPLTSTADAAFTKLATTLGGTDGNFALTIPGVIGRTLTSKLGDFLSVKDFGAVGNGVADDSSAFALALTNAGGKAVYVPPGTYLITAPISITIANTVLFGAGKTLSIIQNTAATSAVTIAAVAGVGIVDLNIQHSSTSAAAAIAQTGTTHYYRSLSISGHKTGISGHSGVSLDVSVVGTGVASGMGFVSAVGDNDFFLCNVTGIDDGSANTRAVDGTLASNLKVLGCALLVANGQSVKPSNVVGATNLVAGNRFSRAGTVAANDGAIGSPGAPVSLMAFANSAGGVTNGSMGTGVNDSTWILTGAGVNAQTLDLARSLSWKLKQTTAATMTYSFTGFPYREQLITVMFQSVGAAGTFAAGANIVVTGNFTPANGSQNIVQFMYDPAGGKYVQIGTPVSTLNT